MPANVNEFPCFACRCVAIDATTMVCLTGLLSIVRLSRSGIALSPYDRLAQFSIACSSQCACITSLMRSAPIVAPFLSSYRVELAVSHPEVESITSSRPLTDVFDSKMCTSGFAQNN